MAEVLAFKDVIEQLQKNNRSEAGRDSRHTVALNKLSDTFEGVTDGLEVMDKNEQKAKQEKEQKEEKEKAEKEKKDAEEKEATMKLFNISAEELEAREKMQKSIDDDVKAADERRKLLEQSGQNAEKDAQYQAMLLKIEKQKQRQAKKNRLGIATRAKDEAKFRLTQLKYFVQSQLTLKNVAKGLLNLTGGLIKGLGSVLGGAAGGAKTLFGFVMNALKKAVLFLFLPALLAFLNSDLFEKLKTFILEEGVPAIKRFAAFFQETLVPILKDIYENNIKPIVVFLKDVLVRQFQIFLEMFKGIGEAIDLFKEGDILGGIKKIIGTLFTFFKDTINNLLTGIFNIIGNIFGIESLEGTDDAFGLIKDAFNKLIENIKNYFFGILDGIKTAIKDIVFQVTGGLFGEEDPEKILQRRKDDLQDLEERNAVTRERIQKSIDSKKERISNLDLNTSRGKRQAARIEKQIKLEEEKLVGLDAEESEKKLEIAELEGKTLQDKEIVQKEQKKATKLELKQLEEPTSQQIQAKQRTDLINQRALNEQAGGAPQVNIVNNSTDNRTNQQNVQSNSHPVMDNDPVLKSLVATSY